MMGGPGRFGNMLNQETLKPRRLSETLSRLVGYFGRFGFAAFRDSIRGNFNVDSSHRSRTDWSGYGLFPRPTWGEQQLRIFFNINQHTSTGIRRKLLDRI